MHDARRTTRGEPLPLEVRQILWQRVWDRLLAPPPREKPTDREERDDPREEGAS